MIFWNFRSDTTLPSSTSPVKTTLNTSSNNNLKQQTTPTSTLQPSQQNTTFQPKDRISSEEEVSEIEEHLRKRQRKLYPENETDEKYKFAPVILDRYQVTFLSFIAELELNWIKLIWIEFCRYHQTSSLKQPNKNKKNIRRSLLETCC